MNKMNIYIVNSKLIRGGQNNLFKNSIYTKTIEKYLDLQIYFSIVFSCFRGET